MAEFLRYKWHQGSSSWNHESAMCVIMSGSIIRLKQELVSLKEVFYFLFNKAQYRFEAKLGNTGKSQSNHHVWDTHKEDELQIKKIK